jgi:threonine dehydrogenase-like Zn-dependent dehydrogenase
VRALRVERSVPRFAAARVASEWRSGGGGGRLGPLQLVDDDPPELPGPDWVPIRPLLAGICGSDLATLDGRSSQWFEQIVSFPFVPGHEVVGLDPDGARVVVNPVLSCVPRGVNPLCPACAQGRPNRCQRLTGGHLPPGLQVGYCAGTGGGWSGGLVAHASSCVPVPDGLSDEAAVLTEPVASAIHGALAAPSAPGERTAVVIGAGTQGLATIAALSRLRPDVTDILAVAKHPEQRSLARSLGAHAVVNPDEIRRAVRRRCGGWMLDDGQLTGGAQLVIDCVGSPATLADALAVTAPGGTVVLTGMPGRTEVDLTPLWQREIQLVGTYTYGPEPTAGGRHSFDLAFELIDRSGLHRLLSATYPLDRAADAIAHAANAGRRGAVKVAFDLRHEKKR